MLLQQSYVATRIRTALLDIEEKVSDEVKVQDIKEEQRLMLMSEWLTQAGII